MSYPLQVDFEELYQRHLCRHSQFGLNVGHLAAVAGIYVSLFAIVGALPASGWVIGIGLGAYFSVLLVNVPLRVWITNIAAVLLLLAIALSIPTVPIIAWAVVILLLHWFQNWTHRFYPKTFDMSRYREKYPKGFRLFATLSLYELPILIQYLVFDRRRTISHEACR